MISAIARRAASCATSKYLGIGHNLPLSAVSPLAAASGPPAYAPVRFLATKSDAGSSLPEPKPSADTDVPSIFDQATGLERAEIEHPDLFKHNEVLRGAFGTKENPVKIPSYYDNRIVGCTGRPSPDDHDIVWLQVEKGKVSRCRECGQYYVLDPL